MKGSYKMYFSARNLARALILLFIVFQVMTVIVTLERYRELDSSIDPFTRNVEGSTTSGGRDLNSSADGANPFDSTTEKEAHPKDGNLVERFPAVLRNLMLQKLGLVSKPQEQEQAEAGSGAVTTTIATPIHPPHSTPNTESSMTGGFVQSVSTTEEEEAGRSSTRDVSRQQTSTTTTTALTDTTLHPLRATIPKPRSTQRQRFSLKNIFLKMILSIAKRIESKAMPENLEVTTEPFTFKGLLTFSSEYDTVGVIRSAGYPVETHKVTTVDGYVLTVHRIPPRTPPRRPAHANYLPVFLQHGLWSSSYHWFEGKPQYTLPFFLSDQGFDVWMGNSRGNVISQEHISLPIDTNSSYWDFSFHEMGVYDLPAVIDLVLAETKKTQVHYIGHSMGTTMFFVMASLRPDIAEKVHFMMALAPIATVGPIRSFFRWFVLVEKFILMKEKPIAYLAEVGISLKTILHYIQLYVTGRFEMYNYGKIANMDIYKSPVPPSYNLGNVSVPTVLCYGTKDTFLTYEDIETLQSSLGNSLGIWPLPLNHFQFPNGKLTKKILYNYIPLHLH